MGRKERWKIQGFEKLNIPAGKNQRAAARVREQANAVRKQASFEDPGNSEKSVKKGR